MVQTNKLKCAQSDKNHKANCLNPNLNKPINQQLKVMEQKPVLSQYTINTNLHKGKLDVTIYNQELLLTLDTTDYTACYNSIKANVHNIYG